MITYIYWFTVLAMTFGIIYLIGFKNEEWKMSLIAGAVVLLTGVLAYYFHFQQVFVKRYGGVMTIHVPPGEIHIAATWKGDNLWIENYEPKTNTCYFREYSRGNLLQGKVVIKDCNPLLPHSPAQTFSPVK